MARYAKIADGVVANIIVLRRSQEAEFPDCVNVDNLQVEIGDTYADEVFYHDGEAIKSIYEQLAEAEAAKEEAFAILRGEVE